MSRQCCHYLAQVHFVCAATQEVNKKFVPGVILLPGGFGSSLVGPIAATAALYPMTADREALGRQILFCVAFANVH